MPVKNAFDPTGREQYSAKMKSVGYVEIIPFEGKESMFNYCCLSCPYMVNDSKSITGYWCKKYGFPDKSFGCCDGYEVMPEVQRIQTANLT